MPGKEMRDAAPDLLPCPFCGGDAQFVMERDWVVPGKVMVTAWKVECSRCWASPKPNNYEGSKAVAAERWNRRADDESTERLAGCDTAATEVRRSCDTCRWWEKGSHDLPYGYCRLRPGTMCKQPESWCSEWVGR